MIFALAVFTADSLILNCNYSVRNLWRITSAYTCTGQVIFVGSPNSIDSVSANHMIGRNNDHVTGLLIENSPLLTVPSGIDDFFPNLEALNLNNCAIREISFENLDVFPHLRQLFLESNNIIEIGNYIFYNNPRLRFITFSRNPIRHVAFNIFEDLMELETLNFARTSCVNVNNGNRNAVLVFIHITLPQRCPPSFNMLT